MSLSGACDLTGCCVRAPAGAGQGERAVSPERGVRRGRLLALREARRRGRSPSLAQVLLAPGGLYGLFSSRVQCSGCAFEAAEGQELGDFQADLGVVGMPTPGAGRRQQHRHANSSVMPGRAPPCVQVPRAVPEMHGSVGVCASVCVWGG